MHQVSKPRSANHSITDECGRPGTCRSKVGCEPIDEPCTKRMVPFPAPPMELFSHRNSLTSPLRVQCSLPCIEVPGSVGAATLSYGYLFVQESTASRRRDLHGGSKRDARHVPEAADASRARARGSAGHPGER